MGLASFTDILKEKIEILLGERGEAGRRAVRQSEMEAYVAARVTAQGSGSPLSEAAITTAGEVAKAAAWDAFSDWVETLTPGTYADQIQAAIDESTAKAAQMLRTEAQTATLMSRLFASDAQASATLTQQAVTEVTAASGAIQAKYAVKVDVNGYVSGFGLIATANTAAPTSTFAVLASNFLVAQPVAGGGAKQVFEIGSVDGAPTLVLRGALLADGVIGARAIQAGSLTATQIKAGTIDADRISIGGVVTANIAGEAVNQVIYGRWADKVYRAHNLISIAINRTAGAVTSLRAQFTLGEVAPINDITSTLIVRRWGPGPGYTDISSRVYTLPPPNNFIGSDGFLHENGYRGHTIMLEHIDTDNISGYCSYEVLFLYGYGGLNYWPGGIQDRSGVLHEIKR